MEGEAKTEEEDVEREENQKHDGECITLIIWKLNKKKNRTGRILEALYQCKRTSYSSFWPLTTTQISAHYLRRP